MRIILSVLLGFDVSERNFAKLSLTSFWFDFNDLIKQAVIHNFAIKNAKKRNIS